MSPSKPELGPVTLAGYTGFSFGHWYRVDRQRAVDYLSFGLDHGVDLIRWALVFNGGLGRSIPAEIPDFWKWQREAAEYVASRGMGQEVSCMCDMQTPELAGIDQPSFFDMADQTLGDVVWILDAGNEYPKNGFDPSKLHAPTRNALGSRGSNVIDQFPFRPPWKVGMGHTNRDRGSRVTKMVWDWHTGDTGGNGTLDGLICLDEIIAFGEVEQSGRTTSNPQRAFSYGSGGRFYAAVGVVSLQRESIVDLSIPGPKGTACLDAFVRGVRSVPWASPDAPLYHGDRDGNPSHPMFHVDRMLYDAAGNKVGENLNGAERTYFKKLADGRQQVHVDDPGPEWQPIAQAGWRIEQAFGREGDKPLDFVVTL